MASPIPHESPQVKDLSLRLKDKIVLVVGSGKCVWDDLLALGELIPVESLPTFVVNDMGMIYEYPVAAWCTLHPEKFGMWQKKRLDPLNQDYVAITHEKPNPERPDLAFRCDWVNHWQWAPEVTSSGSSGLYAVKCALNLGAAKVILAGVPMKESQAHYFTQAMWHECSAFTDAWRLLAPVLVEKVKSMSGYTKELLGSPTKWWLAPTN